MFQSHFWLRVKQVPTLILINCDRMTGMFTEDIFYWRRGCLGSSHSLHLWDDVTAPDTQSPMSLSPSYNFMCVCVYIYGNLQIYMNIYVYILYMCVEYIYTPYICGVCIHINILHIYIHIYLKISIYNIYNIYNIHIYIIYYMYML